MKQQVERWLEEVQLPELVIDVMDMLNYLRAKHSEYTDLSMIVCWREHTIDIHGYRMETDEEESERIVSEQLAIDEKKKAEELELRSREVYIRSAIATLQKQLATMTSGKESV